MQSSLEQSASVEQTSLRTLTTFECSRDVHKIPFIVKFNQISVNTWNTITLSTVVNNSTQKALITCCACVQVCVFQRGAYQCSNIYTPPEADILRQNINNCMHMCIVLAICWFIFVHLKIQFKNCDQHAGMQMKPWIF